jgi:hypothetical protein
LNISRGVLRTNDMSKGITNTPKRIARMFFRRATYFPEYRKLKKSFSVFSDRLAHKGAKNVIPNERPIIP